VSIISEFYNIKDVVDTDRSNRYRNCKILSDKITNESFLSTREIIDIPISSNDIYHEIKTNESTRLDILANIYYRNPLLWWVIAQANNIYNPILPIRPGTIVRIPALDTLYGYNGVLL